MNHAVPPSVETSSVEPRLERPGGIVRLGLIALSTDLTSERDASRLIPRERAVLHVSRIAHDNPTTPENLRKMESRLTDGAAVLVPGVRLAAILYGCTAASVEIGDDVVGRAIARVRPDVPVVTPGDAACRAFTALGLKRIALLTPYLQETTRPVAAYFARRGFEVVRVSCLGLADDRDIARVSAASIIAAGRQADDSRAEALFIACTALPALDVITDLEAQLGKPVVTANQASFWQLLRHAGIAPAPGAPGALFATAGTLEAA